MVFTSFLFLFRHISVTRGWNKRGDNLLRSYLSWMVFTSTDLAPNASVVKDWKKVMQYEEFGKKRCSTWTHTHTRNKSETQFVILSIERRFLQCASPSNAAHSFYPNLIITTLGTRTPHLIGYHTVVEPASSSINVVFTYLGRHHQNRVRVIRFDNENR